jgi:hypothetical protein
VYDVSLFIPEGICLLLFINVGVVVAVEQAMDASFLVDHSQVFLPFTSVLKCAKRLADTSPVLLFRIRRTVSCSVYGHHFSKNLFPLPKLAVGLLIKQKSFLKIAVFWDIVPCGSYMNQRLGGTYHLHLQGRKSVKEETS